MKKFISLLLAAAMSLSLFTAVGADDEIKVTLDGRKIEFDVEPIIENDRVLVPMRTIFEALGAEVTWYDQTWWGAQMASADITKDKISTRVDIEIGADEMDKQIAEVCKDAIKVLSEEKIPLDAPAKIVNDRTLVPLRAVSEAFGSKVEWDGNTRTVTITSAAEPTAAPKMTAAPEITPTVKPHITGGSSSGSKGSKATAEPTVTKQPAKAPSFAQKLTAHMPMDKNYMISPLSLKMALAMTANGADGAAKQEILDALGVSDIEECNELAQGFITHLNSMKDKNKEIEAQNEKIEKENPDEAQWRTNQRRYPEVEIANSIWYNTEYYEKEFGVKAPDAAFSPDFETIIQEKFDGVSRNVNYENAVDTVNGWVNEKTRGKISGIIDEPNFLAALVNAIYMKAQWTDQFPKNATEKDTFTDRNGEKHEIDFMNNTYHMGYYSDSGITMACLPYYGGMSMIVTLGDNTKFEEKRGSMTEQLVHVSLPKFKIENAIELIDTLKDMGIKTAFDMNTNCFDKMLVNEPDGINTFIEKAIQKTYINTDEDGTEAAAVTGMFDAGGSAPGTPEPIIEFKANHPFSFYICDDTTGEILFMGEYAFVE